MAMTLSEMQEFVRRHADADAEDAPNSSLEVYGRIAYNDILSRRNGWPHLAVSYTLTTVAGQSEYNLSAMSGTDMDIITSVVDQVTMGRRLVYMTQADADIAFGTPVASSSDLAVAFSVVGNQVVLYPTPSTVKTYRVRGFRTAVAWPNGAGSTPDLPGALHEAIAWYMLSSYFLAQEDTQLAGVYMQEYETMVDRHLKNETTREYSTRSMVMGGQNSRVPASFTRWVRGALEN
jgi:hypothetical protein